MCQKGVNQARSSDTLRLSGVWRSLAQSHAAGGSGWQVYVKPHDAMAPHPRSRSKGGARIASVPAMHYRYVLGCHLSLLGGAKSSLGGAKSVRAGDALQLAPQPPPHRGGPRRAARRPQRRRRLLRLLRSS